MATYDQVLQAATTDFECDNWSPFEVEETLKSTDPYVQWNIVLCLSPHATVRDRFELNLKATALTPKTLHVKKLLEAICRLEMKPTGPCCNCGYDPCNSRDACRNTAFRVEASVSNNSLLELNVHVSATIFNTTNTRRRSPFCVTVTLVHSKSFEDDPILSPVGPCVKKSLKAMLDSGDMSDVTFVVGSVEMKAHSQFLGAFSDVFKVMFRHDTMDRDTGRIVVPDAVPLAFEEMLRCVYTEDTPAWDHGEHSEEFLAGLLYLAEKYNLVSLRGHCQRRFLNTMTVGNVVERLKALHIVSPSLVPLVADPFVRTHLKEILSSEEWPALMKDNVDLAAKVMYLAMKD